jgi:hypothetical protein
MGSGIPNFNIRDLNYNSHETADVCYADDLVSAVASLMELQAKADVVSAWCIIMGVKVSHAKFRTFGMDWGTKKKIEGKLIIHTEGWTEVLVDIKSDGVLTHLGMVWNTDMKNRELWNGIAAKIEDLGWRIARTWVRAGDKLMAMNYNLRSNICYRLQFATWSLDKYKKLDEIYIRVLRKITKNMPGYPALPMMSGKRDGGLGIETPLMHAHKCKLRILMRGIGKGGQPLSTWRIYSESNLRRLEWGVCLDRGSLYVSTMGQQGISPALWSGWMRLGWLCIYQASYTTHLTQCGSVSQTMGGDLGNWMELNTE